MAYSVTNSSILKIVTGIISIAASAHIAIPIGPVPITFQTVVVMLVGVLYTPKEALSTTCLYLIFGILGLPLFKSGASGLAYATGTSGGYFIGFIAAATFIAYFKHYVKKSVWALMFLLLAAHSIIYVLGVSWLSYLLGFEKALYYGFLVFIPAGAAKTIALSLILHVLGIPRDNSNNTLAK